MAIYKSTALRLKIHYHSDCSFFAGCENMIANFLNSKHFREEFELNFSFRSSPSYNEGLSQRVSQLPLIFPMSFPELSEVDMLPDSWPFFFRRIVMAGLRLIFTIPLFLYEVFRLKRLFLLTRPDILHVNNGGYPGALSARAATVAGRLAGVRLVVMVVNNMAVDYSRFSRWLDYPLDRVVAWAVDIFVTGSRVANSRLESVMRLPTNKLITIHNGIAQRSHNEKVAQTMHRLGIDSDSGVLIGVVALLIPRKGHRVLIDAIHSLVSEYRLPNRTLTVLIEGDGPMRDELFEYVQKKELSDWIKFVGKEKHIVDFMAALDILVLPSVQDEDFPNVVLEAMGLGKPVIASRLAGTTEQIIDGETGFLVEPGDIRGLADATLRLVLDSQERVRMGAAAVPLFMKQFTADVSLRNYSFLYHQALGGQFGSV